VAGVCEADVPQLQQVQERGHTVACHLPQEKRVEIYQRDIAHAGVAR
jgi:peptide/nickel transport system ATP-binding protein